MPSFLLRRVTQAALFVCLLAAHQFALAGVPTCVSTSAQLQAALTAAATDNQPNYIGVVVGAYNFAAPLTVAVSDGYSLTIEGGYAVGCAAAPISTPDNTLITGVSGSGAYVSIEGTGGLTLRNLTFRGFKAPMSTDTIRVSDQSASSILRMENIAISGNGVNGINDSILVVYAAGGLLFHDNIVHDNTNAFATVAINAQFPALPVSVVNNTIASNTGPGLALNVYSVTATELYNNVLWNNGINDLIVTNANIAEAPLAVANVWQNCSGCVSLSSVSANNSNADPRLTATFRLGAVSPAINTGLPVPVALSPLDAAANLRVQGSAPDRGAYETATDDLPAHTYLVTSSADDTSIFTLRGAITNANSQGVPARIRFHIGSDCSSSVILLNSPLPSIAVPMIIDGYSQPGAAANTLVTQPSGNISSNATVCVVLFGAVGTSPVPVAIAVVGNGRLDIRGLAFENFGEAIDLSGVGSYGNWVHGNNFFGPFFGGVLGNDIGVAIGSCCASVVGGPSTADVNLIGASRGSAGVFISGLNGLPGYHTISNNSIGGGPNGNNAGYANANIGVELLLARQTLITNNYIVANGGDGVRINNSTYSLIQDNAIGFSPNLGNNGAGVHVVGSQSSSNWIGTTSWIGTLPSVLSGGNTITANAGPGVWIDTDAGDDNQVTGNKSFQNGGLAIDLALPGPTANTGNEDTGPNSLLHKPLIASAVSAGATQITVRGSIAAAPNVFRALTLYASGRCGGDAESEVGTYVFHADPTGTITFNLNVPKPNLALAYITGTTEGIWPGPTNVSEISNSKKISVGDDLYNDNFDCY